MFGLATSIFSGNKYKEEPVKDQYMTCLLNTFLRCQFFDGWITYFKDKGISKEVEEKLSVIGNYFETVLCAFVINDLYTLLEHYMRNSRSAFVNLDL